MGLWYIVSASMNVASHNNAVEAKRNILRNISSISKFLLLRKTQTHKGVKAKTKNEVLIKNPLTTKSEIKTFFQKNVALPNGTYCPEVKHEFFGKVKQSRAAKNKVSVELEKVRVMNTQVV